MLQAHSVAAIRAAEERVAEQIGWDALMQRAATGLARELDDFPAGHTVAFLIGPGNNGGDALFAAAALRDRGVRAELFLLDAERVHADGLAAALAAGAWIGADPSGHRYCVDALFGIGARGGLEGKAARWAAWIEETRPLTVAVDVPSGIGVDSGTAEGVHIVADRTVTFGSYKPGLLAGPASVSAGSVVLVDIGLELGEPELEAIDGGDGALLAAALPGPTDHKYTRGVVGVATGSAVYAGAAHLSVAGAQAGLAGMVRFIGDPVLEQRIVDRAPEVVAGAGRVQAWVVGSGGGVDYMDNALGDGVPVVVDAKGLEYLGSQRGRHLVLTPHAGELARLQGVTRSEVEADPLAHVRAAADRFDATVLLKGSRTLIATPGCPTRVNLSGTPWLATAGAGDVLAGFIGSLLAAGVEPHDAASLGAFLHGAAAEVASGGPFVASQIAERLPQVIAAFISGELVGLGL